jgi:hypothetical protein
MAEKFSSETRTYEDAKTYLKAAFEHIISAGKDVGELVEFAFAKSGDAVVPYLRRFLSDVHEGRITIQGLTESAKMAVLGRHITAEERHAMIREAAYLRAEQRGFVGGSPEADWVLAEQEVDERLLQQAGLVTKGRRALTSATSSIEHELGSIKDVVTRWLEGEGEGDATRQPETRKAAEKKETAKKSAPTKNTREPVKKTAGKKTKAKPKTKLKAKTETKKAEGTKVTSKKKAKVKQSARAR